MTAPVKTTSTLPPQLASPATWVPIVHALVAAVLVFVAYFVTLPTWAPPALYLAAGVIFVVGNGLYLLHRDRWSKAAGETVLAWMGSNWPSLLSDVEGLKGALPKDAANRLTSLESVFSGLRGDLTLVRGLASLLAAPGKTTTPTIPLTGSPPST